MNGGDAGVPALLRRLAGVERRIRVAVAERRGTDPAPDDPFRGLYLSDETVEALLAHRRSPWAAPAAPEPSGERFDALVRTARLSDLDAELLLLALAPDVDGRFEQFYGYLNDDVTRRRVSVGLALRLCGLPEADMTARSRLHGSAPLVTAGLVEVTDLDRPELSRLLRVPDRVVAHLLGDDTPPPSLPAVEVVGVATPDDEESVRVAAAVAEGAGLAYLTERQPGAGVDVGEATAARLGRRVLRVDVAGLVTAPDEVVAVLREAVLRDAVLVAGPVDTAPVATWVRTWRHPGVAVILSGRREWDPSWSDRPVLRAAASAMSPARRAAVWRDALGGDAGRVDPVAVCAHFQLSGPQIRRAARAAVLTARARGGDVTGADLRDGARSQNSASLERLARRVTPSVGWDDLVLPEPVMESLRELADRARYRDQVLDRWRMRPGAGRGRGVTALFAGDSGTGKTMSAEVIAHQLGMDLYTVNLATVVDKYIGETEKNLERIFTEAVGVNGVLLFDEADAIFGKRSEVRDARDRYANVESAYLLQRMETFDGLAILATNLRANLDDAFTRRLDVVADFPLPGEPDRRRLWDRCLGDRLPRDEGVDLDFLAASFDLAGGHIRSAAVTAAYLAAAGRRPVTMPDLVKAVAREYQKLGRLCLEREFGPYLQLTG
ncbi:ATPase family protein associated with various cellular activities (AAA) [Stackebrandtia albiflava]|uniref:ATPase family protein associated with various cellular activities (AAA) n=1 Tax=Stackebrandtia albiflava TaxID=406432 RepID=A0A562UPX6_9ACTN|nr:ATP-binding protein [Stackebrandtia albiflava]TWJ07669.1 ATPase family protein associated with various cellular activities (AAA) [Stackebrandtia albiflava]